MIGILIRYQSEGETLAGIRYARHSRLDRESRMFFWIPVSLRAVSPTLRPVSPTGWKRGLEATGMTMRKSRINYAVNFIQINGEP